jgi:glycosyltransferase involved in cell wall biosynthesis
VRIALVTDTYTPQVNGVTTVVRRIADLLTREGHAVGVVAPAYPGGGGGAGGGRTPGELRVTSLPFPPYPAIRLSLPFRRRVARFLESFQPDVVHVATEGPLGFLGRGWALRRGVPLATSFHTHFPQYARHYGAGFLEPVVWRWLLWFHGPAGFTHTPGAAIRDELVRRGLPGARVWGRGVDSAEFRPDRRRMEWRRSLGVRDDQVLVLHVGRLAAEKNVATLVAAWRLAAAALGDRAAWLVAGEGPELPQLRAALPAARYLGFLERDVLAALYASADLCVLPSRTETCGLVALEAMASGVPVIAADAGGFRESVHAGVNGLLVPPEDAAAFARAIAQLVDDAPRRAAMAIAAREAAVVRDVRAEDADLLAQYRALTGVTDHGAITCAA